MSTEDVRQPARRVPGRDWRQSRLITGVAPLAASFRLLVSVLLLCFFDSSVIAGKPVNVLLIICDDLNTHVSSSGYQHIHTPALSALAADSLTFDRAYCQYPVCGPSRASILSGLYPQSTGVLDNTADILVERPGTVLLPQLFRSHGYWTASTGKVFHSPKQEPGELVWDKFVRFENDELPVVKTARQQFEATRGSVELPANRQAWRFLQRQAAAPLNAQTPPGHGRSGLTDEQHRDGKNARQVARWLQQRTHGDKPFFIACGIQKPHVPFLAPDRYFDLYPADQIPFTADRPDLWDSIPRKAISGRYTAFGFELGKENPALRREYMQAYHACISFLDAQLQLMLDALRETGHWEDTVVVFTSDHGYHLGDHFLWGKVTLFDIGTRVPMIVRVPGVTAAGSRCDAVVELIDLYPTLARLADLTPPADLQGVPLQPLLQEPHGSEETKHAYTIVRRGSDLGYSVRSRHWRYARWPDGEELYDLQQDPDEKRNLAGQPRLAERLESLRDVLQQKQQQASGNRNAAGGSDGAGQ